MSIIKKATSVLLEGRGEVTLRPADYVTQGGEGAIYRKGQHIVKLYLPTKIASFVGQAEKIKLLARTFKHPSIVSPQGLVFSKTGETIGFYMPYIEGEALPPLFTNDRAQRGFTHTSAITLAHRMREVVQVAHEKNALLIDGNELNWLADITQVNDPVPYIIDVDSWQIGRFTASVIMPSIRDWHSQRFSPATDWFAWGVVTFNLLTGIHPYKGKLDDYKPNELERRMKENASVFHPNIRLNQAVRDFSQIPGPLLDWYHATFANGVRTKPPSPLQRGTPQLQIGKTLRMVTTASGGLVYKKLFSVADERIISVWPSGVVRTADGNLYEVASKKKIAMVQGSRVAVVARDNGWLVAEAIDHTFLWRFIKRDGSEAILDLPLMITGVFRSNERLFVTTETELIEILLTQFARPVLSIGSRWQILGQATSWYHGIGISNVLGTLHIVLPFGAQAVAIIRAKELDDVRIITASAGNRFAEIITLNKKGEYEAWSFTFDKEYRSYVTSKRVVDGPEQNLTILPKGVVAKIETDGILSIMVPQNTVKKAVADTDLSTAFRLSRIGDQVVYLTNGELWSLKTS